MHPTPALPEELDFRHSGWWERRKKIFAGMTAAGFPNSRLERFANCGTDAIVCVHEETGEPRLRATYCHDRNCQPCSRAKALLIADNVQERLHGGKHLHIVLTKKHNACPLGDQVTLLYKQFKTLRGRPLWKQSVHGGCAFLQCHRSKHDGLWHVHFHVIGTGVWLDKHALSDEWRTVTGDSDNVDVSAVADTQAAAREVSRYAAKPIDGFTVNDPDSLAEVMRATSGRHLCFTFGSWRGHRLTKREVSEDARNFRPAGRLSWYILLASQGDVYASEVIRVLKRQSHPATGPPHLFYDAEVASRSNSCNELVTRHP